MAALPTNVVSHAGLRVDNLFLPAAGGGDTCQTGRGVCLLVKNTGSSATVTIATPGTVDGDLAIADRTFTIAATTGESCIPVPDLYRNPSTGRAAITYSAATDLDVCVVRVP